MTQFIEHSLLIGMVHFFAAFLKARYIIFLIDSSFGKTPLFLIMCAGHGVRVGG